MSNRSLPISESADSAAVFGAALSLYNGLTNVTTFNPSDAYQGCDEFMRQCMRVATLFENWACEHINFDQLVDVWPYLLEDKFSDAYLKTFGPTELARITETECAIIATNLGLVL